MITKPHVVTAAGVIEAWMDATRLLLVDGDRFNLTVHIVEPASLDEVAVGRFCHRRVDSRITKSVYDVANTIFPNESAFHSGPLDRFFDHYGRVYTRGQRKYRTSWGCYFLRLISFGAGSENQLQKILSGLSGWACRPRAAFVVHLSSSELDNPRPLGAPCWQYGQFVRDDDSTLSLVAVYRSQDYFQKALGNFVGLTRLLKFVCHHANMTPGTLTCLSTYATFQGKQSKARELLQM